MVYNLAQQSVRGTQDCQSRTTRRLVLDQARSHEAFRQILNWGGERDDCDNGVKPLNRLHCQYLECYVPRFR